MCGADDGRRARNQPEDGSPPRVRGRQRDGGFYPPTLRFTPACAGQTIQRAPLQRQRSVHPRVCGADALCPPLLALSGGSPPRVRGRRERRVHILLLARFTPACAGQTPDRKVYRCMYTVHPRVCGADVRLNWKEPSAFGSPPRVRGRLDIERLSDEIGRFTPACAGQTSCPLSSLALYPVHPRVCGADRRLLLGEEEVDGSPPRVRGRRWANSTQLFGGRFTPACAGQTDFQRKPSIALSVHPRVCGADMSRNTPARQQTGSPPRVRGRHLLRLRPARVFRFTPACAGQTTPSRAMSFASSVHPRVCGADACGLLGVLGFSGSPPRVRGRPRPARRQP